MELDGTPNLHFDYKKTPTPFPLRPSEFNSFPMSFGSIPASSQNLIELLQQRILVLDGAMGTLLQALQLSEAEVRGERFAGHSKDLNRFPDILCLTRPDDVTAAHRKYFEVGADIVETNSFGASLVGVEEFDLSAEVVREINREAVRCARRAADEFSRKTPGQPRFVAGSIGPTAKQMSISTNAEEDRKSTRLNSSH